MGNVCSTLLVVRNNKKQRDQRSQCILSYHYERHKTESKYHHWGIFLILHTQKKYSCAHVMGTELGAKIFW